MKVGTAGGIRAAIGNHISDKELYPFYTLDAYAVRTKKNCNIIEFKARYKRVMKEFEELQGELADAKYRAEGGM